MTVKEIARAMVYNFPPVMSTDFAAYDMACALALAWLIAGGMTADAANALLDDIASESMP